MSRFFAGLLIAIGVLLAGTTGLCTSALILISIPDLIKHPEQMLSASPLLLTGIIPCVIGIFIARAGLARMRSLNRIDTNDSSP